MSKEEKELDSAQTIKLRASKNYLGKPDFFTHEGKQIELTLKISKVVAVKQDWHGSSDAFDIVLAFEGVKKRLICNKTNQVTIAKLHGDGKVAEVWLGKTLTLFWTKTEPGSGKRGKPDKDIRNPQGGEPGGVRIKAK